MTNKKVTRRALLMSVTSLLICISMLLGTTFAWFTDEVTSGVNKIVAGNLDVELFHSNAKVAETKITGSNADDKLFFTDVDGNEIKWEPGAVSYEVFSIKNVGTLALKYQLSAILDTTYNTVGYNTVQGGTATENGKSLLDVLRVVDLSGNQAPTTRPSYTATEGQLLGEYLAAENTNIASLEAGASDTRTIIIFWPESDNDNIWNLKNGKYASDSPKASDATSTDIGALKVSFAVKLIATQYTSENDSFDNMYDDNATGPNGSNIGLSLVGSKTGTYSQTGATALNVGTNPTDNDKSAVTTTVAANTTLTYKDNNNVEQTVANDASLKLTVEETDTPANFTVTSAANETTSFEVTLETVTNSGNFKVSSTDKAIITDLYIGVVELAQFAHNGVPMTAVASKAEVDADGEYYYDVGTGYITMATKTFSPFTAEYKYDGGLGDEDHPYVIAGVQTWKKFVNACAADSSYAVTNGKYFDVTTDIDASAYTERMNIKYFAGHIDFNNHTISGFNSNNVIASDIGDDGLAAVFSNIKGTVKIENLKFTTSKIVTPGNAVALSITGVSYYNDVDITFENIKIFGTVTGATGNNNALLLSYILRTSNSSVTCKNCDNYSYVVGSGYRGVFLGNIGYATSGNTSQKASITFINCNNYGTLVSTRGGAGPSAAMLLSNPGYPKGTITVTVENCKNSGKIMSPVQSNLFSNTVDSNWGNYIVNGTSMTSDTLSSVSGINGNTPSILEVSDLTTSGDSFTFNKVSGADHYELDFSFTARSHAGGNVGYSVPISTNDNGDITTEVFVGSWITKEEAKALEAEIVNHGTYYTCGNNYVFYEDGARFEWGRQVVATFIAYNENDELISIATYTYPYVNN